MAHLRPKNLAEFRECKKKLYLLGPEKKKYKIRGKAKISVYFLFLSTPPAETSRMEDMFALCHVPIPLFIFFNHTDKTQLSAILYGSGVKVRVRVFLINIKVKVHLY